MVEMRTYDRVNLLDNLQHSSCYDQRSSCFCSVISNMQNSVLFHSSCYDDLPTTPHCLYDFITFIVLFFFHIYRMKLKNLLYS
jgi:hypothetical protein